ncbi:cupin domain-containing protein [Gordonia sp. NPDC003376]
MSAESRTTPSTPRHRGTRRVITQTDPGGSSVFADDSTSTRQVGFDAYPRLPALDIIWGTTGSRDIPFAAVDVTREMPFIPRPGDTVFFVNVTMPDAVLDALDPKEVETNFMNFIGQVPEFGQAFDLSRLGMHRTNTIEYGYVLSGQVYLEVDGGEKKLLSPGDTWVNNAAMHAWRNPFDEPCISVITMQGIGGPTHAVHGLVWKIKHALWRLINRPPS